MQDAATVEVCRQVVLRQRSKIKRLLVGFGVVIKAEVDSIVETGMAKGTDSLQSNIVNAVESIFEDALQSS